MQIPTANLPIIDISPFLPETSKILDAKTLQTSKQAMAELTDSACRNVGFFYLVGHGVSDAKREGILNIAREFFMLDLKEKEKISITNSDFARGFQRLGQNVTRYEKDWHEAIDFYAPVSDSHPLKSRGVQTMTGENQYPENPAKFKETCERYVGTMKKVGMAVMRCIAMALKLEEDYFVKFLDDSFWVMRMIGYPPLEKSDESVGISCGEHSDYGCLTILNTDSTPDALQVLSKSGQWITANPIPGAFVINIGDMLNIWTNDVYKSTLHRVIHTKSNYRVSVPFFFEPNFDAFIEPLEICYSNDGNDGKLEKRKYTGVVYGDHLLGKVASNFDVSEEGVGGIERSDLKKLEV